MPKRCKLINQLIKVREIDNFLYLINWFNNFDHLFTSKSDSNAIFIVYHSKSSVVCQIETLRDIIFDSGKLGQAFSAKLCHCVELQRTLILAAVMWLRGGHVDVKLIFKSNLTLHNLFLSWEKIMSSHWRKECLQIWGKGCLFIKQRPSAYTFNKYCLGQSCN